MQAAPPGARASSPTPAAPEDPETGEPVADQGAARSPAGLALPPGPGDALEHRPGRPRQQSQGADLGPAGVPSGVARSGPGNRSFGWAWKDTSGCTGAA